MGFLRTFTAKLIILRSNVGNARGESWSNSPPLLKFKHCGTFSGESNLADGQSSITGVRNNKVSDGKATVVESKKTNFATNQGHATVLVKRLNPNKSQALFLTNLQKCFSIFKES